MVLLFQTLVALNMGFVLTCVLLDSEITDSFTFQFLGIILFFLFTAMYWVDLTDFPNSISAKLNMTGYYHVNWVILWNNFHSVLIGGVLAVGTTFYLRNDDETKDKKTHDKSVSRNREKPNFKKEPILKVMGTSQKGFENEVLDYADVALIKFVIFANGKLDRTIQASIEAALARLVTKPKLVQEIFAEVQSRPPSIHDITRPFMRRSLGRFDSSYHLFQRISQTLRHHGTFDSSTLQRLIEIGQALQLDQNAIYTVLKNSGLAQ